MDKVSFIVYENDLGFIALDSNQNAGYGNSTEEAIADLQLSYDESDFDVDEFVFTLE